MDESPSSSVYSYSPKSQFPKNHLPASYSIDEEALQIQKHNQRFIIDDPKPVPSSHFQKIVAELVGTFIFVFIGAGAALVDRERPLTIIGIALAAGSCLMALIYALGHVSGAHFNPAVSISLASSGRLPLAHVPMYVLPQLLGSILACLTLKVLFNDQPDIKPALTQFSAATTHLEAIVWEFILTFILMFTINGVATDERASKGVAGVSIGVVQMFNIIIAGPITGASMNPARSVGPAVVNGVYKNLWIYIVGPILGAMAASLIYSILRSPKPEKQEESTTKSTYNDLYLRPEV